MSLQACSVISKLHGPEQRYGRACRLLHWVVVDCAALCCVLCVFPLPNVSGPPSLKEAVAGASVLGALAAPQLLGQQMGIPVMAAQAPGVITGA